MCLVSTLIHTVLNKRLQSGVLSQRCWIVKLRTAIGTLNNSCDLVVLAHIEDR